MANPKVPNIYFWHFQKAKKVFDTFQQVDLCTSENCLRGFMAIKNVRNLTKSVDDIFYIYKKR